MSFLNDVLTVQDDLNAPELSSDEAMQLGEDIATLQAEATAYVDSFYKSMEAMDALDELSLQSDISGSTVEVVNKALTATAIALEIPKEMITLQADDGNGKMDKLKKLIAIARAAVQKYIRKLINFVKKLAAKAISYLLQNEKKRKELIEKLDKVKGAKLKKEDYESLGKKLGISVLSDLNVDIYFGSKGFPELKDITIDNIKHLAELDGGDKIKDKEDVIVPDISGASIKVFTLEEKNKDGEVIKNSYKLSIKKDKLEDAGKKVTVNIVKAYLDKTVDSKDFRKFIDEGQKELDAIDKSIDGLKDIIKESDISDADKAKEINIARQSLIHESNIVFSSIFGTFNLNRNTYNAAKLMIEKVDKKAKEEVDVEVIDEEKEVDKKKSE